MTGGRKFLPERRGGAWCWRLPPDTREAWLVSRPAAGQAGADGSEARPLGVAVRSITLDGRRIPLDDPRLCIGWHAPEPGVRWTTGAARIAGPLAGTLRIRLAAAGRYWRRSSGGAAAG
jgi:hypothetical protein